jgi:hypothetical protein
MMHFYKQNDYRALCAAELAVLNNHMQYMILHFCTP